MWVYDIKAIKVLIKISNFNIHKITNYGLIAVELLISADI